jgi:hypothetical protein
MTDTLRLWSALGKTDPAHTKPFNRGGFRGTSIKPIYTIAKMTEHFGPCGKSWGIRKPEFQVVPTGADPLVICTVCVWYVEDDGTGQVCEVYGVGGDTIEKTRKDGPNVADDESFKKAYTDAVGNALKHIGVNSDVHMGMFDDTKYVSDLKDEFAEKAEEKKRQDEERRRQEEALVASASKIHLGHIDEAESIADLDAWRDEHAARVAALPYEVFSQINAALLCRGFELAATVQQFTAWQDSQRGRPRPWTTECLPGPLKAKVKASYTSALERFKSAAREMAA